MKYKQTLVFAFKDKHRRTKYIFLLKVLFSLLTSKEFLHELYCSLGEICLQTGMIL